MASGERRAQGTALNIAPLAGARVVVPRRFTLTMGAGDGSLRIVDEGRMDPACIASLHHAWAEARGLAGGSGTSCEARFSGDGPIRGGSAGAIVGLHAVFLLRGAALPQDVFATGAVGPGGRLLGGSAVAEKACGLARSLAGLGLPSARLLCPPIPLLPSVDGVHVMPVESLAQAVRALSAAAPEP